MYGPRCISPSSPNITKFRDGPTILTNGHDHHCQARCIQRIRGSYPEREHSWQSHACSPIGRRLPLTTVFRPLPPRFPAYLPKRSHSTFHISKTLNHLSVLSRACLAVIDRSNPHVWHWRGAASPQGGRGGMQQPPGSCAHRAHSSWYGGIATRDFEELPCGKVGPCLELPLGGRQPSHPWLFRHERFTSAPPG